MGPPLAPSDDPTGGRGLTQRLKVVLPIAFAVGLAIGIPVAILVSDWRPAIVIPLGVAALAGTVVAAMEDGRVQRRVDAATGQSTEAGLRSAWHAAHEDDDARAEAEVRRALLRGATPARSEGADGCPGEDGAARRRPQAGRLTLQEPPPAR